LLNSETFTVFVIYKENIKVNRDIHIYNSCRYSNKIT